ncbi:MAG TPA: hypothetical protein PLQ56_23025 [Aggregatilineales bacterium]|nr:hypothetical protein [Aggregatilineales bacterium]
MRHLILILFALVTTLAIHHTHAQETTPELYPIIERCLTDLREPPDEWTFEGTIVTFRGGDGVHGFRSDFPTRYYIAFNSDTEFSGSGSFSPDGQWFATYIGETYYANMISDSISVNAIRVISTLPSGTSYIFPYYSYGWDSGVGFGATTLESIRWLDSERFVAFGRPYLDSRNGWHIYNLFTAEISSADEELKAKLEAGHGLTPDLAYMLASEFASHDQVEDLQPVFRKRDYPAAPHVYVTRLTAHIIEDTCIESYHHVAISPTGDQAAVSIGDFVYILDLDEWVGYRLNLAANDVVGWFADPVP